MQKLPILLHIPVRQQSNTFGQISATVYQHGSSTLDPKNSLAVFLTAAAAGNPPPSPLSPILMLSAETNPEQKLTLVNLPVDYQVNIHARQIEGKDQRDNTSAGRK